MGCVRASVCESICAFLCISVQVAVTKSQTKAMDTHMHILAESLNFAEPEEVSMPDSESTHKVLQNGGVDVSIGAR